MDILGLKYQGWRIFSQFRSRLLDQRGFHHWSGLLRNRNRRNNHPHRTRNLHRCWGNTPRNCSPGNGIGAGPLYVKIFKNTSVKNTFMYELRPRLFNLLTHTDYGRPERK